MHRENKFNLVDEPWIPVKGHGIVSLKDLFNASIYLDLAGTAIQKIALMKFLLAIAQSAHTPVNTEQWLQMGMNGMSRACLEYLEKWHSKFFLYGKNPFLQMHAIHKAEIKKIGDVLPEISTGNTTVLMESQVEKKLEDADKAVLLVTLMGYALGGKKADNKVILSNGYQGKYNDRGKASTGKPGPFIDSFGVMHNFLKGQSLLETIWLNLLCQEDIQNVKTYTNGLGVAPWEEMPQGECCSVALRLQYSLMGRLVPLSRFCLLTETGLHYSEGIQYVNYLSGGIDPSVYVDFSNKKPKVIWIDPEKRPWRHITSLISLSLQNSKSNYDCLYVRIGLNRIRDAVSSFGIWSGGLKVSGNAGEQYVSGSNDFVESEVWVESQILGERWYSQLKLEMDELDKLSKRLYVGILKYFDAPNKGKKEGEKAVNQFWQLCESNYQKLINECDDLDKSHKLRGKFAKLFYQIYDQYCPKDTARQLDSWAKNRPNISYYLTKKIRNNL